MNNQRVIKNYIKELASHRDINAKLVAINGGLELHFSIQGPAGTMFQGGIYHGVLIIKKDFPCKAPQIMMLTPSGRFKTNESLCIMGYTDYHDNEWSPKTFSCIIRALQSLFSDVKEQGIGYDFQPKESDISFYCKLSRRFKCEKCGIDHSELSFDIQ